MKRYQVFVSSTFADLKEERALVVQALMKMDCIPAGMEMFPAADEEQLSFIKRIIDDCDYYIVIIGGRYGSVTAEGVSYTEREYEYALGRGLKVLAFLHKSPGELTLDKSEQTEAGRAKLSAFREKVARERIIEFWDNADMLPGQVALSLLQTIKTYPAVGWIRADRAASVEILSEVNELRKKNAELISAASTRETPVTTLIPDIAGLDEFITVHGMKWTPILGPGTKLERAVPSW